MPPATDDQCCMSRPTVKCSTLPLVNEPPVKAKAIRIDWLLGAGSGAVAENVTVTSLSGTVDWLPPVNGLFTGAKLMPGKLFSKYVIAGAVPSMYPLTPPDTLPAVSVVPSGLNVNEVSSPGPS